MKYLFIIFLLLPLMLQSLDIAITIDDFPMADGPLFKTKERTDAFLDTLSNHKCKAAFFCIGKDCQKEHVKTCLNKMNDSGHFLANHSMTHSLLSRQPMENFESEIKQMENILSSYKNSRKWYRYPGLDYGNRKDLGGSEEKYLQSLDILRQLNYTDGFVTINTFDWHINKRLKNALEAKKSVDYHELKKFYISLLKEWCNHFIDLYKKEYQGKITHTLLLHANDLNALYLKDILQMLKDENWNIVSPEAAFNGVDFHKHISGKLEIVSQKPLTMNYQEIDKLIDAQKIFWGLEKNLALHRY